jgi:hypothetical protein
VDPAVLIVRHDQATGSTIRRPVAAIRRIVAGTTQRPRRACEDPVTDETPNPAAPEAGPPAPGAGREPTSGRAPTSADVRPRRPDYRGEELDPERGPGLGCFWFQVIVLGFFIVIIPVGLNLGWPFEVLAILLFVVIGLLLLTGQTVIFLLRLVAADRRAQGRRRPLASSTKTVGELEDEQQGGPPSRPGRATARPEGPVEPVASAAESVETAGEASATAAKPVPVAVEAATAEPEPTAVAAAPEPEPAPAAEPEAAPSEPEAAPSEPADVPAGAEQAPNPPDDASAAAPPAEPEEPDPGMRQ